MRKKSNRRMFIPLLLCIVMIASLLSGCSKDTKGTKGEQNAAFGNGDVLYSMLYASEVTTLNYLVSSDQNDHSIAANVIDTLVEYDSYGNITPSLAKEWNISEDGITYTFKLREGQKWYDNTGAEIAEITAQDFVDAMKYILTSEYESSTVQQLFGVIENAEEYFNGTMAEDNKETEVVEGVPIDFSTVGIKALDKYTLEYTLVQPTPYFLSSLSYVCYMPAYGPKLEELGASFGAATDATTILYNGSFILSELLPQEKRVLRKNMKNWDAEHVYIDTIEETYNAEAATLSPTMVLRDEVDYAGISSDIIDEWLNDPVKSKLVSKGRLEVDYSYFYSFNFDPQFEEAYEPENWKIAVNNENFRQAIMAALDRKKVVSITEPNSPESMLINTITPKTFVNLKGVDYTEFNELSKIWERDSFNDLLALDYKEKAMQELKREGASFPIKILVKYNPNISDWDNECVVLEQQMEGLLGTDFIDIIVEAGPPQSFLSEVRRSGKYALMKCNWGADFADPVTFTDPFAVGNNYNFMDKAVKEGTDSAEVIKEYYQLVEEAKTFTLDLEKRYEAFAKAEAFLIEHALVIPYAVGELEYRVTKLNVFEAPFASFGVSILRYKGQKLYEKAISMEEFNANYESWEKERKALFDVK